MTVRKEEGDMKSFVDKDNKPITPSYVHLPCYGKMLKAHEALQIGKSKDKDNPTVKEVRYTDMYEVRKKLRHVGYLIGQANETRDREIRAGYLFEALTEVVDCYLTTRTVLDLHYLTDARFADFTLNAEDVRRQLYGWYTYTLGEIKTQNKTGKRPNDDGLDLFYDIPELPSEVLARLAVQRIKPR